MATPCLTCGGSGWVEADYHRNDRCSACFGKGTLPVWTLKPALDLVRHLVPKLKAVGWYPGLTGSVLFEGHSTKDLDLILYPSNKTTADPAKARTVLLDHGLKLALSFAEIQAVRRMMKTVQDPEDTKCVERWKFQGSPVDVFFLN